LAVRFTNKPPVILADGVDFVVDVKGDLKNSKEILRALNQIRKLKKLRRVNEFRMFGSKASDEEIETLKHIPENSFCITYIF